MANDPLQLWQPLSNASSIQIQGTATRLSQFATFSVDSSRLQNLLSSTPLEASPTGLQGAQIISLPTSDGKFLRFQIVESPVMAPELAAKFPEIKTYRGQGIDDPASTVRLDITPAGFHAQVISPSGTFYIDPQSRSANSPYISYYKRDAVGSSLVELDSPTPLSQSIQAESIPSVIPRTNLTSIGTQLRTYDIAVATTGEYTAFHGGTVPLGLAAVVTAINRNTGIYETEVAVRFQLVANNNLLIYTNSATDPYTNSDGFAMLDENQATVDSVIGNANYDIGHVFGTGSGGLAGLGVVGLAGRKAQGVTGLPSPIGDAFSVDFVAHEIGHQFGGNHTFNANDRNRNASTAFEPGSGSSIMAYAGFVAPPSNLQPNTDIPPYFHSASFNEITNLITTNPANAAATITATGNSIPTVSAGAAITIPARTPFALTASGSDANGDTLSYAWEQRDLGVRQNLPLTDNGTSPIFRAFSPSLSPTRVFPRLTDILSNNNVATAVAGGDAPGELLPTTTRTLNFKVTARDNRSGGGGVNSADVVVSVSNTGAPFQVTSPNTAVSWTENTSQTVTWDVAGTTVAPINTANVDIELSTDGGNTFPTVLLAATPNDGTQSITVPNTATNQARVRVRQSNGGGNFFFDVSNTNFTIGAGAATPTVSIAATDANKNEGNVGTTNFTFTATRAGSTDAASDLSFAVSGAAVNGTDFVGGALPTGNVTFPIGSTTQTVTIPVQGDTAVEANEDFTVTLTSVTNATVTTPTATGTIVNDDSNVLPPLVPTPGTTNIPSGAGRLLLGNNLDNVIVGAASNDTIYGYAGNDVVDAAGGNDYVDGGIGNDLLFGGMGNDTVVGGAGFDTLSGVSRSGANPSLGEQDRLIGGNGNDDFLLGDSVNIYYTDNNPATSGLLDFAIISDFIVGIDRIQLNGLSTNYAIGTATGGGFTGAGIFRDDDGTAGLSANDELIGILSGISPASLNLNSSTFAYV